MKILLRIPLSSYTGYGNDGIGLTRALVRAGADVYLQPSAVEAPIPKDVALLLTKTLEAPFDMILTHLDPGQLISSPEQKRSTALNVAWTMWEFSNLNNLKGRSKLKKNLEHYDALIGYDDVSVECLKPYTSKPVLKVQGGYEPKDWPPMERDWNEDNFYFCMIGMLGPRKNPFAAIQAFSELKNEHEDFNRFARLSLKTQIPGLHSAMEDVYPGLRIYYDVWPTETVKQFYQSQHVLLAPSHGEGKNMPALEFMTTGGTVIATNWGGHTGWLNPDYSYPLDYELAPMSAGSKTQWADVSIEHLKATMLHVFRNRDEARRKGELAAQVIPQMLNWDKVVERLLLQLKENVEGGDRLWTLAHAARQEKARA